MFTQHQQQHHHSHIIRKVVPDEVYAHLPEIDARVWQRPLGSNVPVDDARSRNLHLRQTAIETSCQHSGAIDNMSDETTCAYFKQTSCTELRTLMCLVIHADL